MGAADILLPRLGHGKTGSVVEWLVADGDLVEAGSAVAEVETEKVTTTLESPVAGVVRLLVSLHEDLLVGTVIAHVEHNDKRRPQ